MTTEDHADWYRDDLGAFGAAMDVEISDVERTEAIHARIRDLYNLLSRAVDEQIAGHTPGQALPPATEPPSATASVQPEPQSTPAPTNGATNGNGNGHKANSRRTTASEAQCRAIFAICKSLRLDLQSVLAPYRVADAAKLPIQVASRLIDELKARQTIQPQR